MAKLQSVRQASGNPVWRVFLQDSSSTTGAGLTGLTSASSGLKITLIRELDATTTNHTVAGSTIESITTLGTYAAPTATKIRFKEIDATNLPGWYELHAAQAQTGTGDVSRFVSGMIFGATNLAPCPFEVELQAVNSQSAATFMTGVNGVAPPTNWNLDSIDASGRRDVIKIAGTTQTARDIGASVLLSAGTGTGQLDFTAGVVKSNLVQILATALTETAGQIAAAFKKFFDIASPTSTMNLITGVTTVTTTTTATNLTNAPTAGDLTATMKASVTAAVPTAAAITTAVAAQVTTDHGAGSYIRNTEPDNASAVAGAASAASAATSAASAASSSASAVTAIALLPTAAQNADKLLGRAIQGGADGGRTVTSALRKLRNRVKIFAGVMTVYQEDDTTSDHTLNVTTSAGDPINETDPT